MVKVIKSWALLVAVLVPTALFAQEQSAAEEPASEAAEETGQQTESDLAIGTEVTGPRVGETYVVQEIKDWTVRCVKTEGTVDPCRLNQLLRDAQGTPVAEINFFTVPDGGQVVAGASVVTPLETLLTEQIRLSVDSGTPRVYPFRFCSQIGCVSRMGFTAEDLDQFKRGAQARIVIVPVAAPDAEVVLAISLTGFTAGFDALSEPPAE